MHAPASVCRMSDLGGELDALASGTGFSGVVRIDQSDRIELARAYGLAHRGFEIANAVDTRFGLASGAKGFTALAVVSRSIAFAWLLIRVDGHRTPDATVLRALSARHAHRRRLPVPRGYDARSRDVDRRGSKRDQRACRL